MDYGILLGAIGVLATIILGILPLRKSRKGGIEFIEEENINLYNSVVKNISDLTLTFQSAPIKENIYLLRGFIFNVGLQDITPQMVEKNLKMILSKKGKWLNVNLINKSEDLKANLTIKNNALTIDTGLLRNKEFIYFESIIETPNQSLNSEIKFDHRIADTPNIAYKTLEIFKFFKATTKLIPSLLLILFGYFLLKPNKIESHHLEVFEATRTQSITTDTLVQQKQLLEELERERLILNEFDEIEPKNGKDSLILEILSLRKVRNKLDSKRFNNFSNYFKENFQRIEETESVYKFKRQVREEYSYIRLFIKGKTKMYNYGNGGGVQFYVESKMPLYLLLFMSFIGLYFLIILLKDLIYYRRLKPLYQIINTEIEERKKKLIIT